MRLLRHKGLFLAQGREGYAFHVSRSKCILCAFQKWGGGQNITLFISMRVPADGAEGGRRGGSTRREGFGELGANPAVCQATLKTASGCSERQKRRTGCCFQATAARVIVIFMSREVVTFDAARLTDANKMLRVDGGEGFSYKGEKSSGRPPWAQTSATHAE